MNEDTGPLASCPATDFSLPASGGATVSLADLRGQTVVLYFYPKDDTSGCTREALDFTGLAEAFEEAGATVLGISATRWRSTTASSPDTAWA